MSRSLAALGVTAVLMVTMPQAPPAHAAQPTPPAVRVRIPLPSDDGTLTPYTFEVAYPLMALVYDTLLQRDVNGVPQPWLATSAERSADGLRVTVRLADGARWQDGPPVTSADVAFTFGYIATHPHPRFTGQVRAVVRVETPDPATAVIVLRRPSPGFFDQPLADVPILPAHLWRAVPRSSLAPEGLAVGSGPYRLVAHEQDVGYRFEAVTDYFKGAPAVQAIDVPIIASLQETILALDQRRVDMIPVSLPKGSRPRIEAGTRVARGPSYLGTVLVLNLRRPPFDQVENRQAVARAIDTARIATTVGNAVAADRGYLHPESPWSPPKPPARSAPAAARVPAGLGAFDLNLLVPNNDPVKKEAGRQVVLALRRAGLQVEIDELPRQEVFDRLGQDAADPSFDLAISTSPPLASYDPDFLRVVFSSDPAAAPLNDSGYASSAFDTLAERVATTTDPVARHEVVEEALRLLTADVPVVPLFFSNGAFISRPSVYDGWMYVKGSCILDKRSFLAAPPAAPARSPAGGDPPESSPEGGSPLGIAALVLVGVAVVMATVALASRRR